MSSISFGQPPGPFSSLEDKIDYCIRALREVEIRSNDVTAQQIADNFTITNLNEDRALDCDSTSTAELADLIGTVLQDLKDRGPKRFA